MPRKPLEDRYPPSRRTITKATCGACERHIHMVPSGDGGTLAVDPELISVIPAGGGAPAHANRVHAELCTNYQQQRSKERHLAELRAYNRRAAGRDGRKARGL
jgi:hypothetical protein